MGRLIERRRTGTVKLDWRRVDAITEKVMKNAEGCRAKTCNLEPCVALRAAGELDAFDRRGYQVFVRLRECGIPEGAEHPRVAGQVSCNPNVKHISVTVEPCGCLNSSEMRTAVRSTVAHELSHVNDPTVCGPAPRHRPVPSPGHGTFCAYVTSPSEAAAFLNTVRGELFKIRDAEFIRPPKTALELLYLSRTYQNIAHCLTPQLNRRYFQMVARNFRRARGRWWLV